jgi:hypothetical protein
VEYAIVGMYDAPKKAIEATLDSLWDAAEADNKSFGLILPFVEDLPPIYEWIEEWCESTRCPFTAVTDSEETFQKLDRRNAAEEIFVVKRVWPKIKRIVTGHPEASGVLVLSESTTFDEDAAYVASHAFDEGVFVALAHDLTPVTFREKGAESPPEAPEAEEEPSKPEPEEQAVEAPSAAPHTYTEDDLSGLSRAELKALVSTLGVVPTDLRSKQSMIDAILGDAPAAPSVEVEEESVEPVEPAKHEETKPAPAAKASPTEFDPDIVHRFTNHPPQGSTGELLDKVTQSMVSVGDFFITTLPEGREKTVALMKLEEASMWAKASLARNQ